VGGDALRERVDLLDGQVGCGGLVVAPAQRAICGGYAWYTVTVAVE
jgi:hypothetical protein